MASSSDGGGGGGGGGAGAVLARAPSALWDNTANATSRRTKARECCGILGTRGDSPAGGEWRVRQTRSDPPSVCSLIYHRQTVVTQRTDLAGDPAVRGGEPPVSLRRCSEGANDASG